MESLTLFYLLSLGLFCVGLFWLLTDPRSKKEKTLYYVDFKKIFLFFTYLILIFLQYVLLVSFPNIVLPGGKMTIYFGLFLFIFGGSLAVWSKIEMQSFWGTPAQHNIQRQTELITTGPFAFTRNPIYVSLLLMVAGYFIALQSIFVLLVLIPFEYFGRSIQIEENLLEQYFGPAYLQYKKKVRRWL